SEGELPSAEIPLEHPARATAQAAAATAILIMLTPVTWLRLSRNRGSPRQRAGPRPGSTPPAACGMIGAYRRARPAQEIRLAQRHVPRPPAAAPLSAERLLPQPRPRLL